MAILITGGCGYIGSHTCIGLIKAGCDIVVIDNYYNSKPEALRRTRELAGRDFPFYECDIRDRRACAGVRSPSDRRGNPFRRAQGGGRIGPQAPRIL